LAGKRLLGESEGELTFVKKKQIYYIKIEIITNIKIVSLQDQILLLLQLGDRDISRLPSSHQSSHLQSLLTPDARANFYLEVESFTKMEINLVRLNIGE